MSKIKEVLRLKYLNQLSNRQIQTMTGVSLRDELFRLN